MEPIVRNALLEDLGRAGDITSDAITPADCKATLSLNARQAGVVAGLDLVMFAFLLVDPGISIQLRCPEGGKISTGQTIAIVNGPARSLLTAERTALNFLCKLSGIATATATLVNAVRGHNAKIVCTRKTTPGLRVLEKYAVRAGGGANHRFALDDAVLIKDNHIAIAGDIRTAIERARSAIGHMNRDRRNSFGRRLTCVSTSPVPPTADASLHGAKRHASTTEAGSTDQQGTEGRVEALGVIICRLDEMRQLAASHGSLRCPTD